LTLSGQGQRQTEKRCCPVKDRERKGKEGKKGEGRSLGMVGSVAAWPLSASAQQRKVGEEEGRGKKERKKEEKREGANLATWRDEISSSSGGLHEAKKGRRVRKPSGRMTWERRREAREEGKEKGKKKGKMHSTDPVREWTTASLPANYLLVVDLPNLSRLGGQNEGLKGEKKKRKGGGTAKRRMADAQTQEDFMAPLRISHASRAGGKKGKGRGRKK